MIKFLKWIFRLPLALLVGVIVALPFFNVILSNYLISKYGQFFATALGKWILITWLIIYTLITLRLLVGVINVNFMKINPQNLENRKFYYEVLSVIILSLITFIFAEHYQFMEVSIVLEDSLIPPFFNHYINLKRHF